MLKLEFDKVEEIRREWTDKFVTACDRPELQRFAGRVGRVVTVNCNGNALVDFADGAWYDIPASSDFLTVLSPDDPLRAKHDSKANSAQPRPDRGG